MSRERSVVVLMNTTQITIITTAYWINKIRRQRSDSSCVVPRFSILHILSKSPHWMTSELRLSFIAQIFKWNHIFFWTTNGISVSCITHLLPQGGSSYTHNSHPLDIMFALCFNRDGQTVCTISTLCCRNSWINWAFVFEICLWVMLVNLTCRIFSVTSENMFSVLLHHLLMFEVCFSCEHLIRAKYTVGGRGCSACSLRCVSVYRGFGSCSHGNWAMSHCVPLLRVCLCICGCVLPIIPVGCYLREVYTLSAGWSMVRWMSTAGCTVYKSGGRAEVEGPNETR